MTITNDQAVSLTPYLAAAVSAIDTVRRGTMMQSLAQREFRQQWNTLLQCEDNIKYVLRQIELWTRDVENGEIHGATERQRQLMAGFKEGLEDAGSTVVPRMFDRDGEVIDAEIVDEDDRGRTLSDAVDLEPRND